MAWCRGHNIVLLSWKDLAVQDRWDCCRYPQWFRTIPCRIRCAWQPVGILDISFHVSVFLLSLPWARLCLWSWRLAQTCCYVGFYGGKKNIRVARPERVLKKEKKERGRRGVRGSMGWRRNVILVCSEGEILISPLSPHYWIVPGGFCLPRFAKSNWNGCIFSRGVLLAAVVPDPAAQLVCPVVWEPAQGSPLVDHRGVFLSNPLDDLQN